METYPQLINVLPNLAKIIKDYFINKYRIDLANQVDNLRIKGLCECADPDCGSFYLTEYVENEDKLEGFKFEGIGTIEVYEGKIGFVEIFPSDFGYEIRSTLKKNNLSY
ncbi:hypothetical protein ACSU6B_22680 [Neobacillus sp. C211]|uniref:hypothetical protein n=1 Tax=unclassified Neobacillus TaxID=2675272 RepID=UPI003978434A